MWKMFKMHVSCSTDQNGSTGEIYSHQYFGYSCITESDHRSLSLLMLQAQTVDAHCSTASSPAEVL